MIELKEIIGEYEAFIVDTMEELEEMGFDVNDIAQVDNLRYRVATLEDYAAKRSELENVANELTEITVSGRPVTVFRLIEPILVDIWRVDAIELAAPKPDRVDTEGIDRLECVIYDDFETFLTRYEGKPFDLDHVSRTVNPSVRLPLQDGSVSFHLLSLTTAVYLQQTFGIQTIDDEAHDE